MSQTEVIVCSCGLLVVEQEELDEAGLCCDCASLGDAEICICEECEAARVRLLR
jgi:hypothetical protein